MVVQVGPSVVSDTLSDLSMHHMMKYCQIHGYQYHRCVVELDSADAGWRWPADVWSGLLTDFEIVVAIEFGTTLKNLMLSFHDMLPRWGLSANTLVLQPLAAAPLENLVLGSDGQSALGVHTSLVVVRNHRKVVGLLHKWHKCFTGGERCSARLQLHSEQECWTMFFRLNLASTEWVGAPWNVVDEDIDFNYMPAQNEEGNANASGSSPAPMHMTRLRQRLWPLYMAKQRKVVTTCP